MEKKKCSRCKKIKDIKEFRLKGKKTQPYCIECNKKYGREHYKNNKKYYYERNKKARIEHQNWFRKLKSTFQCIKCGENHIGCLDFHHRNSNEKEFTISVMVSTIWSKERILKEIEKCDVLCANCHRKLHYEEKYNSPVV